MKKYLKKWIRDKLLSSELLSDNGGSPSISEEIEEPRSSLSPDPEDFYDEMTIEEIFQIEVEDDLESFLWLIEVFDPEMHEQSEYLLANPPMLYGPHTDVVEAMTVLDIMLSSLNEDFSGFTGRIRPLYVNNVEDDD